VLGVETAQRPHSVGTSASISNGGNVIILGIILLILGAILHIPILWTLGIILVVIGLILALLGAIGRGVGGRRHYY